MAPVTTPAPAHGDVTGTFSPAAGTTALAGSSAYGPCGTVTAASGSMPAAGYQGDYTDPVTGLVYMNARWYNPASGTFVSGDTLGGSPAPAAVDGNPYAYAGGNPLTNTDPTGQCWSWAGRICHAWHAYTSALTVKDKPHITESKPSDVKNPKHVPGDKVIDEKAPAVKENPDGLKPSQGDRLGCWGNLLDGIFSQAADNKGGYINPYMVIFNTAVGGELGAFGNVGKIIGPLAGRVGEDIAYNIVYGVADLGSNACNNYQSEVLGRGC